MSGLVCLSPYELVDHSRWIAWWGEEKPFFPKRDRSKIETVLLEAESGEVGADWEVGKTDGASAGKFLEVKAGKQSLDAAPSGKQGVVDLEFEVKQGGPYALFARLNCASADDDSFWIRMDKGNFQMCNNLVTPGWSWVKLDVFHLEAGKHHLTIGYREDGAKLDRVWISNDPDGPESSEGIQKK